MKGRRKILTDIGRTLMLDDTLPDFKSFPINELRFIASIYEDFQKTANKRDMRTCMSWYFGRECEVEHLYSPIPATLTKVRMISELVRRWTIYENVRNNHNHKKPEDGDCPICMDCISTHMWNPVRLNWDLVTTKQYPPGARFPGNLRTPCGHSFCGWCWEMHMNANSKVEYRENTWRDEPTGRMLLSCPMCRYQMHWTR